MSKKDKKNKDYLGTIGTNCSGARAGAIELPKFNALLKIDEVPTPPYRVLRKWLDDSSVFFGGLNQFREGYYVGMAEGEDGNIIAIGANGSGKTTEIIMPTMWTWKGPMCVTDVKGELSTYYQDLFQKGIVKRPYITFDVTEENCRKYDPFQELRTGDPNDVLRGIREIVSAIHPAVPNESQPFWAESERAVLTAGLLHYYNKVLSFIEAVGQIASKTLSELCEELEEDEDEDVRVGMLLGELRKTSHETRANIDRGLRNVLMQLLNDPCFINAFQAGPDEKSNFTWDDLEESNIFLCIPADRIDTCGRLINLMYSQLLRHLERRPEKYSPEGQNNAQTLLLMDEFARFGKLDLLAYSIATLRSKSVNFCLVVQSIAQLDKIYGQYDRRIIMDNCQYQAILRANDADTQRYLSELIGTRICTGNSVSVQMDTDMVVIGYSLQVSERRELAIQPHELSTLTDIILLTPYGSYRLNKLPQEPVTNQSEVMK